MAPGQTTEIARAAEGPALTDHVIASIVEKSDGIPLFTEEIAAAVVHHTGGEFTVPDSLENLLMSRLEALGELRDIAQAASIIGRELRLDELALLTDIDESGACELLELGVQQELFFLSGTPRDAEHVFKQALVSMLSGTGEHRLVDRIAHERYSLSLVGRFTEAHDVSRRIAENTGAVGPATTTMLITLRSTVSLLEGDLHGYGRLCDELLEAARRYDLRCLTAIGSLTSAANRATLEPSPQKLAHLHSHTEQLEGTGALIAAPIFLWTLAGAELACGRPDKAEGSIALAQDLAAMTHQRWCDPQIAEPKIRTQMELGTLPEDWVDTAQDALAFAAERSLRVGALHVGIVQLELQRGTAAEAAAGRQLRNLIDAIPDPAGAPTVERAERLLSQVS